MFKCQLAPAEVPQSYPKYWEKLNYPLLCSPKLDGIRGHTSSQVAWSRTNKPLPSLQIQSDFVDIEFLDGEFIEGRVTDFDVYNRTQSHVMSVDKPGDISFHVFDYVHPDWLAAPFYERLAKAKQEIAGKEDYYLVPHTDIESYEDLVEFEDLQLELGFEGIMMRNPIGRYKTNARCTINEGIIFKLKRFTDAEAIVVGFEEQMDNHNIKEVDERGYSKRSKAKEGLLPANTLGKFIVYFEGQELAVGAGNIDHKQRKFIWDNKDKFIGSTLKFRYFTHGVKDKPRHPRALGFRSEMDM